MNRARQVVLGMRGDRRKRDDKNDQHGVSTGQDHCNSPRGIDERIPAGLPDIRGLLLPYTVAIR